MTFPEFQRHVDALKRGPALLEHVTRDMSDAALHTSPEPNKWSPIVIVAHLADTELVFGYRIRQVLAEANPTFAPIDQDAWAEQLHYRDAILADKLEVFRAARKATLSLLTRVTAEDIERKGFHPEYQRHYTLGDLVQRVAAHDANHIGQIERIKLLARGS
jgi:hypothetical protein